MEPLILRGPTVTAQPPEQVPIYLIHSLDNPFCPLPGCWCHTDQERIAPLLEEIREGKLTFREAADFADGRMV